MMQQGARKTAGGGRPRSDGTISAPSLSLCLKVVAKVLLRVMRLFVFKKIKKIKIKNKKNKKKTNGKAHENERFMR